MSSRSVIDSDEVVFENPDQVVAIIGAGISGVAAAKAILEVGLRPVVFEARATAGGLWAYDDTGYGVMSFTHINVSKDTYAFSDFPFPAGTADYPHHSTMAAYINNYVDHFKVREHIQFQSRVVSLTPLYSELATDSKESLSSSSSSSFGGVSGGAVRWWRLVTERSIPSSSSASPSTSSSLSLTPSSSSSSSTPATVIRRVMHFRRVIIASGHHSSPSIPSFPGQSTFTGRSMHSVAYKSYGGLEGRRVLVVGLGNSAVDVAVNAATAAKSVHLSTRTGAYVAPNYLYGIPLDHYASRFVLALPLPMYGKLLSDTLTTFQGPMSRWGLQPKTPVYAQHVTISSYFLTHIARQSVIIKPDIKRFDGPRVEFTDGTTIEPDVVIFSTGYRMELPYLDPVIRSQVLNPETHSLHLFENVFSTQVGSSLGFIGFVQPTSGGILSMAEIQSRWFAQLAIGAITLPSVSKMEKQIQLDTAACARRFVASARHTIQRDPLTYNDRVASYFGAKPQWWRHPLLLWWLIMGPATPAQWRLQGPHTLESAPAQVRALTVPPLNKALAIGTVLLLVFAISRVRMALRSIERLKYTLAGKKPPRVPPSPSITQRVVALLPTPVQDKLDEWKFALIGRLATLYMQYKGASPSIEAPTSTS